MFNILALRYVRVEILLTCEKYFHDPIEMSVMDPKLFS
jgi:hypothetical protein